MVGASLLVLAFLLGVAFRLTLSAAYRAEVDEVAGRLEKVDVDALLRGGV